MHKVESIINNNNFLFKFKIVNLVVVSEKEEILEDTGQETAHVREEDAPNHQDNDHVEAALVHQRKIDH